jgi:hypothetical protein
MTLSQMTNDLVAEATGRRHREDPIAPTSGGPAGNAVLTAWIGLVLLVLIGAELITLLNLSGLISWHIGLGVALIPPALLKTGTTGWRIVRYYTGDRSYRAAGPPPILLRLLGPLVIAFTLALLGSGILLVVLGPQSSRTSLLTVFGHPLGARQLHAALALGWAAVTGVHVLARLAPAVRLVTGKLRATSARLPGTPRRAAVLIATAVAAALAVALVLPVNPGWALDRHHRGDRPAASGQAHG